MIKILDNYILSKMTSEEEVIPISVSKAMLKFINILAKDCSIKRSVGETNITRYSSFGITLHFYNNYEECTDSEFEYFLLNEIAKNYNK